MLADADVVAGPHPAAGPGGAGRWRELVALGALAAGLLLYEILMENDG